jgi:protein-disulfide isomerase
MRFLLLALVALSLWGQAPKKSSKKVAPTRDMVQVEGFLRHLNLWTPDIQFTITNTQPSEQLKGYDEITVKASLGERSVEQKYFLSADGKTIIRGEVMDTTANPFNRDLALIRNVGQPSLGTVGAPVVLSLYTDYQCPYCKEMARTLRTNLMQTFPKDVRLFVHDFPLEQIHPWARPAAVAGRCVMLQGEDNYWKFHDWVFDQQQMIKAETLRAQLLGWAPANGIDVLQLNRCLDEKVTEQLVAKDIEESRQLGINSTPTIYVNGRKLAGNVAWEQLKRIIEVEVEYQKKNKNAGDLACCSVSLLPPGAK